MRHSFCFFFFFFLTGGVDAPLVAGAVVRGELDAVGHGVELAVHHGVLEAQRGLTLVNQAVLHVLKELERLLDRALAPRRRLALDVTTLMTADLAQLLVTHVRVALH